MKQFQIVILLGLNSLTVTAQDFSIPTTEHIKNLSEFRSHILQDNRENLEELNEVLIKFSENDLKGEAFTKMIYKIIIDKQINHFSSEVLALSFDNDYPEIKVTEKITASDIYVISKNSELLEMILAQVIKPEFPFSLSKNTDFFKEYSFYEIDKNDKVGEIGSGLGGFSLMLAIIENEINLTINELSEKKLWYIQKKFNSHEKYLKGRSIEILKGDKNSTNFGDGMYDKIIVRNSFHHFKKKKSMLESISRALKNDGALYLYEPFLDFTTEDKPCKKMMFKDEVMEILNENGFVLEKSEQLHSWYLLKYIVKK